MNDLSQELPPLPDEPQTPPMDAFPADTFPAEAFPEDMLPPPPPVTKWQQFWRRFGGDGFLVSMGIHAVLIIIALTWVVSRFVIAKEPTTFATGAGGGDGGDKVSMLKNKIKPKHASNIAKNMPKLAAKGTRSAVAIPEMPSMNMSALDNSGSLAGGGSKGLGGGGGGGDGPGMGPGFGGKGMVSLFGVSGFGTSGLVGVFYDFKQDPKGNFKDPGRAPYVALVRGFMKSGWSETYLRQRFFSAPDKLTLTHVFIPQIPAEEAPKAYNVADKVKPSRWMAHYRGSVTAPISGRFRFVGAADDWIVVRWGGRVVLDSGYDIVAQPEKHNGPPCGVADVFPSSLPIPLRCGPWLTVAKGRDYPIEVAIGETPGGVFYAYLCYETEKEPGKLKLFRMGAGELPAQIKDGDRRLPPVDMNGGGLVWKPGMKTAKSIQ